MHWLNASCLGIITLSLLIFFTLDVPPQEAAASAEEAREVSETAYLPIAPTDLTQSTSTTVLFVGDMMLGRHVETLSKQHGFDYPYSNLLSFLNAPDYTIGNFEGSVPPTHVPTPAYEMQFSFADDAFHQAALSGFDIFSLGNNHSDDYGLEGYENTLNLCALYNIECKGHPYNVSEESVSYLTAQDEIIGILFIDGTELLDLSSIQRLIKEVSRKSDLQLVYVHWGDEYILQNNKAQQKMAHSFIDAGVDVVIGHHPHVVQNLEVYKNSLIVYSLGNFIFDQYFSKDVQEGLMLGLEVSQDDVVVSLFGVSSIDSPGSPFFMNIQDEQKLFERIFASIKTHKGVDAHNGHVVIKR